MSPPTYGRYVETPEGLRRRYLALDPAGHAAVCNCGKTACPLGRLLPIRRHIAVLHRLLSRLRRALDEAVDVHEWDAVLYGLQMAASISDVEADTGYVEHPQVFALCEPSIDYEHGHSEMASKYVAGLSVFSFLWVAYEAMVACTATGELRELLKGRLGERGRRLLEARPALGPRLEGMVEIVRNAGHICLRGGLMEERVEDAYGKYRPAPVFAAELAREFRNHLFHGEDAVPDHPDWAYGADEALSQARLARFYAVGQVLLVLIQGLAVVQLEAQGGAWVDEDGEDAVQTLLRLHIRPATV